MLIPNRLKRPNPSGNYIDTKGLKKLIEWAKGCNISLIIDESFVDFADEVDSSIIKEAVLGMYDKLYVMKSISKSYGVPGIRLGVLASSDVDTIARLKKDVAIWNINSYGEFFMQIFEMYEKTYAAALAEIRARRYELFDELSKISYLRPIKSQANYIMCELVGDITSRELCEKMLAKNVLIKDLSSKVAGKQYVRIAVRDKADNAVLVDALKDSDLG